MASINTWLRWRKGSPSTIAAGLARGYARGLVASISGQAVSADISASMTITESSLDTTTAVSFTAATTAADRASVVVSALTGTVLCEVYDGTNTLRASGTMLSPWATASGSTITVGEVTAAGITVASGGTPDSGWYLRFSGGGRWVRGSFGVLGSGRDYVWSLPTFTTGTKATLATVVLTAASPASAGAGYPLFDSQYGGGPSHTYQHRLAQIPWDNAGGDWMGSGEVSQGATPYASLVDTSTTANHTVSITVTTLLQFIQQNNKLCELWVRTTGSRYFASRQHANTAYRARINVTYADTTTGTLAVLGDGHLSSSTSYSPSTGTEVQCGSSTPAWFRFESPAKPVSAATLVLTATQSFGGNATLNVFRVRNQGEKAISVQTGIAAAYTRDVGIAANPAVVRHFDFQATQSTWKSDPVGDINSPTYWDPNSPPTDSTKLPLLQYGKWIGPQTNDYSNYEVVSDTYTGYGYKPLYPGQKALHNWFSTDKNVAMAWETFIWPLEPELYLRYYLFLGDNFFDNVDRGDVEYIDLQMNGKFGLGFAHRSVSGNGGSQPDGTDGWTMRANFTPIANSADPKWKSTMLGDYPYSVDYYYYNENWGRGAGGMIERGRWYCIERYMKINTPSVRDGISRAWVDGKLVYEKTDHIWRTQPPYYVSGGPIAARRVYGDMSIIGVWWDTWNGGLQNPPNRADNFISDIVISRSYIGPMNTTPPVSVPSWVPAAGDVVTYSTGGGVLTNTWRSISDPSGVGYDTFFSRKVTDYSATFLATEWKTHGGAIIWGGGHSATNYNGVTVLTFGQSTMTFECLQTPTPWTGGLDTGNNLGQINSYGEATTGAAGRLGGPHSYGSGDAVGSKFIQIYNQAYGYQNVGQAAQAIHELDLSSATSATARVWTRRSNTTGAIPGGNSPTHTRYVSAQNRIYFMRRGLSSTMAWVDLSTNTYVNGTGADFGYENSDSDGGDPVSGGLVYAEARDLLIGAYRQGGNLVVQYANVAAGVTQPAVVTATLNQTLAVPVDWGAISWCSDSGKLLVFGVTGNTNRVYEITIPANPSSTWTVDSYLLPGGKTITSINRSSWAHSFDYNPKTKAIVFLPAYLASSGNDTVAVYRPRNT